MELAGVGEQDDVRPCEGGQHRGFAGAVLVGDGLHLHAVGGDEAGEADIPAQQPLDDPGRKGGRILRFEGLELDVGDHHGRDPRLARSAERHEIGIPHVIERGIDPHAYTAAMITGLDLDEFLA